MDLTLMGLWSKMGFLAKAVVFLLLGMSLLSFWAFIDRFLLFFQAKKQSLQFIAKVAPLIKANRLEDVVNMAKSFKNSHLAKVFTAGILEFQAAQEGTTNYNVIEAAKRAIERATVKTSTEMKRWLSLLATVGSTAPFVGLFGTVVGIINAFHGISMEGSGGIGAVAGGIAEALITTAFGIGVAVLAVWFFNYFINKSDLFEIEMRNSSSELVDHFIKISGGE
ncbi:MAG: MotA/TolQ/ExbB proton channel family protein [Acidobacteria bacterium]|nr:MotA/TolQ/ExbB proton channel family protein [Acidobacteriota bacterium]